MRSAYPASCNGVTETPLQLGTQAWVWSHLIHARAGVHVTTVLSMNCECRAYQKDPQSRSW